MSHPAEDHFAAFFALLQADASLTSYDGQVPAGPASHYALIYFYILTPDGLQAPDAVSLTFASGPIDARAFVHCVGPTASSARAVAGRVRDAVIDQVLTIDSRTCFPIRWQDGQPPQRDEEVPGTAVHDLVDVYGWRSVPA